jgi:antirestriction protein ArdC
MQNYVTKKLYTGNNLEILFQSGFENPNFMTYRQGLEAGRQVRKGEKGIQLCRVVDVKKLDKKTGEVKKSKAPRYFTVFNFEQTDAVEVA